MCVSPFSVNWDCRKASWDASAQGFPNQCSFPEQAFGASSSELFGQCQFTDISRAQLAMSDEVLAVAAARTNNLPTRSPTIQVCPAKFTHSKHMLGPLCTVCLSLGMRLSAAQACGGV